MPTQVSTIAIDNPPVNCLSPEVRAELMARIIEASKPHSGIRAVVVYGENDKFSAGGDISELAQAHGIDTDMTLQASYLDLYRSFSSCPVPVLAAINGYAFGGGLELALCCDIRYVTPETRLAASGVKMGLIESAVSLPRVVASSLARELIFTGRVIDGYEAVRIGLASRCVPGSELLDSAMATAEEICRVSPESVRATKRVVNMVVDGSEAAESVAAAEWRDLRQGPDHHEAVRAFFQKRPAVFHDVE